MIERARAEADGIVRQAETDAAALVERRTRMAEDKIAAIGIRVKQWVTLHGIALNVEPELSHFSGIVPCGVSERRYAVTSLADLGISVSLAEVDTILRREFTPLFGFTPDQTVGSTSNRLPSTVSERSVSVPSR